MIHPIRGAFLIIGVLLLAGCTATESPGLVRTAQPTPWPTTSASATPAGTPAATCENIVTASALTKLSSAPNDFFPEFTTRMRVPGSQLYRFIELGGIACEWGHPNSDVVFDLATSPITDAQAAVEKAALIQLAWVSSPAPDGGQYFTKAEVDPLYLPVYAFSSGRWRYALLEADLELFA